VAVSSDDAPEALAQFEEAAAGLGVAEPEPETLGDDLISAIEQVLEETPAQSAARTRRPAGSSPLFSNFSEDELVAVIGGLELKSFEPGDILISEGEPGDSLFVLTTGIVKAFVRNASGRNVLVREMAEGAFFGEVSILSGTPRTATITARTGCELLELDRATLDGICATHPHVREVLQQFYAQRVKSEQERRAREG
jgi:cAMP-dependent protein kinase regulator